MQKLQNIQYISISSIQQYHLSNNIIQGPIVSSNIVSSNSAMPTGKLVTVTAELYHCYFTGSSWAGDRTGCWGFGHRNRGPTGAASVQCCPWRQYSSGRFTAQGHDVDLRIFSTCPTYPCLVQKQGRYFPSPEVVAQLATLCLCFGAVRIWEKCAVRWGHCSSASNLGTRNHHNLIIAIHRS